MSDALLEILTAMSVRISVKVSTESAETLLAPALISILATDAFGIVELFLPIKPQFLACHRSEELYVDKSNGFFRT